MIFKCRSCQAPTPRTFLSLGETPLADALVPSDELDRPEPRFPLDVAFCPSCSLVQITEEVGTDQLFVDNYLYFSSYSDHLLSHARRHAEELIRSRNLDRRSLVVEVGSNDGYLLKCFAERGIRVLGIDPAPGQAAAAEAAGIPTLREFFGTELARQLTSDGLAADVIVANNVMAHTPDLNGFVEGLRLLVADGGTITIENPYVRDLIVRCEFDTIYHEHFSYFSCAAVDSLMRRHALSLNRVEYFPDLHGGTLRWHVGPKPTPDGSVERYLASEEQEGLLDFPFYERFAARVESNKAQLLALLGDLKKSGRRIAAYGAAAKGSTLLNYAGIGLDLVDFVVDRNVHKQDLLMPGVHIPVTGPSRLLEEMPDYLLLLAWNFADEIIEQQTDYRSRGGRFIIPIPSPEIV